MLEEILTEFVPSALSAAAILISIFKKEKKLKSAEEIEAAEEAKKQKRIKKALKKNKVKPIDDDKIYPENLEAVYKWPEFSKEELTELTDQQKELIEIMKKGKPNWQQAFGVKEEQ